MKNIFSFLLVYSLSLKTYAQQSPNNILGKWMTTDNRLIIQVYRQDNDYKARILWFKDVNDSIMHQRLDEKNPDRAIQISNAYFIFNLT